MLINCPECQILVSNKALMCPHCGYPFKPDKISPRKSTRKKRLPNGFGQISFIKGNLRKPYRAMVTIGKNENGRPICKLLKPTAYFETYNEAYEALMNYNRNPSAPVPVIMDELYEMWKKRHLEDVSEYKTFKSYDAAWKHATLLHDKLVSEVRVPLIEQCFTELTCSANQKGFLKTVLNQMFDYAVVREMTDRNYARAYTLPKNVTKEYSTNKVTDMHAPFSEEEIGLLIENINVKLARVILIQCYTGFRPSELLNIKLSDVNLNNNTIIGGMKTEAGTDRIVPIHSKIRGYIASMYALAKTKKSEYLVTNKKGLQFTYDWYRHQFENTIKKIQGMGEHVPHDPRLTFVTMAKKYYVDEYAIKRIVGHKITDITERVYTKRDVEWLKSEIEKIK